MKGDNALVEMRDSDIVKVHQNPKSLAIHALVQAPHSFLWVEVKAPNYQIGDLVEDSYGSGDQMEVTSYVRYQDVLAYIIKNKATGIVSLRKDFELRPATEKFEIKLDNLYSIDKQPKNP